MKKIYDMVKSWYDKGYIDEARWQAFCTAILEALMEDNKNILKRLKNR